MRRITESHLAEVPRKIADLRRMARVLGTMAAECAGGAIPACPVIDALFDETRAAERHRARHSWRRPDA